MEESHSVAYGGGGDEDDLIKEVGIKLDFE